jgi:hypothetical protein
LAVNRGSETKLNKFTTRTDFSWGICYGSLFRGAARLPGGTHRISFPVLPTATRRWP